MAATKTESSALLQESGKQAPEMTWRVLCTRTIVTNMVLLSLLQMLDKSDMKSTIAGMLRALELDFGIDADQEALLLVISALPLAIFAPVWGLLADSYPRFRLMIVSAIFWGLTTFISAFSQSFALLCFSRGLTAVALGGILPISQGIVADLVPNVYRGRMFALLTVCGGAGAGFALLIATDISTETIYGMRGWRWVFLGIAILSLVAALFITVLAVEPVRKGKTPTLNCETVNRSMSYMANVPTFALLVLQAMFGLVPWSAFSGFGPLWLQYSDLSRDQISLALVCFGVGNGFGELLGGLLGDIAASYAPDTGRVRVAQVSVLLGITWVVTLFCVISDAAKSPSTVMALLFFLGLTGSWVGSGVKTPMLAEIVPSHMMVSVMGVAYGLEHASSSIFGSLVTGVLAQHVFGYDTSTEDVAHMPQAQRRSNATALSSSIGWMMVVPWIICLFIWSAITWTYPKDRDRVLRDEEARAAAEGEGDNGVSPLPAVEEGEKDQSST
eukprot:jgi/Chrpa1/14048/Chrysochromulina_OHIO_Genome00004255-RA